MSNKILPELITVGDLGGIKKDIFPMEDPETELNANEHNLLVGNLVSATNVVPKLIIAGKIINATPTIEITKQQWGATPSPVFARVSQGVFSLTLPLSCGDLLKATGDDEYQNPDHSIIYSFANVQISNLADYTLIYTQHSLTGNVLTIKFLQSGALIDPSNLKLTAMVF